MLGNPYVEMLGSITLIMAIIVGYAVMLFVTLAAFVYPVAKFGKKLVFKLLRIQSPSKDPFPLLHDHLTLNQIRELNQMAFANEMTQTILPKTTVPAWQYGDVDPNWEDKLINSQTMPGLSYLAGRPIEANSEDTQFMDKVTTMHHQI